MTSTRGGRHFYSSGTGAQGASFATDIGARRENRAPPAEARTALAPGRTRRGREPGVLRSVYQPVAGYLPGKICRTGCGLQPCSFGPRRWCRRLRRVAWPQKHAVVRGQGGAKPSRL